VTRPRSPTKTTRREGEALLDLGHLVGQRARIGGRAVEHLDGDRAAVAVAQQAVDDLRLVLAVVTAVAESGEFALAALQVGGADVVEHEGALAEMALGERPLDSCLLREQPVEGGVDLALLDDAEAKHFAETGSGGIGIEGAHGAKLGGRRDQAVDEHRQYQVAAAPTGRAAQAFGEQLGQAEGASDTEDSGDMAVRQGALDRQRVLSLGHGHTAAQQRAQALDEMLRPTGEVGKRALPDFPVLAITLAEQDGGARIPVRNAFDMHDISNHVQARESIY
jgi:hypothetical protein